MVAPVQNKTTLGNTRSTSLHNSKLFTSSGKGKGILKDSSPKKKDADIYLKRKAVHEYL